MFTPDLKQAGQKDVVNKYAVVSNINAVAGIPKKNIVRTVFRGHVNNIRDIILL